MKISPFEFVSVIKEKLNTSASSNELAEVGRVVYVSDGIATVYGLDNAMSNEMVEFEGGITGVVLNLEKDAVGVVILDNPRGVRQGMQVKRLKQQLTVEVGEPLIGRVVDALGKPIDGLGDLKGTKLKPLINKKIETEAPSVIERTSINEPLQTGIKAIDGIIPIGKGQRELILGDRQTGKTAIVVDTILHQGAYKNDEKKKVICVYVAIGQKSSSIAALTKTLAENNALDYTIVVAATAAESAARQFFAAYTGCTIGEYFRDRGQNALVIYDDLSKHAVAYREISLLLRRPPGREAYPGDVFYIHARLLERAARLSAEQGGGSLTALPIIQTQNGDVSAYIPTNVISITDGQIFLEADLFYNGIRPAINFGLSVSRVGSAAQTKAIKKVVGSLKLALAQYREVVNFAQFSSDLDAATKQQLHRGERLVELLKQGRGPGQSMAEQVVSIYSGVNGFLDTLELEQIAEFEEKLLKHMHEKHQAFLDKITNTTDLDDTLQQQLKSILQAFLETYAH